MQTLYSVKAVSCWYIESNETAYAILYAFCLSFVCSFRGSLKAPGRGGGLAESKATTPGGAWNVAGIVLHRVTFFPGWSGAGLPVISAGL
jgi:hypothetical protein